VIAVNESSLPVTANMISAEVTSASATVLFENRNVNVVNGGITDTFAGYQRHVYSYSSDLAGHWKLDETSGTVALDSSCNDHDGTVVDATWTTAGKIDGALSFTGSTSYVVADGVEVNTVPGGFNTIAFWMKWNGVNNQMPFGWNQAYGYDLWIADGSFGINTGQGNILGIPSAGMAGQWVHVAAVFPNGVPSASNAKIYINGVNQILTDRSYPTTTNRSATSKLFISGWGASAGYKFGGTIDDVRVYNRALTAEEVAAIAAAP